MQPITTTLKAIRQHRPCGLEHGSAIGYQKLVKFLGKDYGDETPIRFSQIIESNGVDDAYWCLRALPEEHDNEVRLLLADVAERVLHIYEAEHPNCKKPRQAIEAARAYARGEISKEELAAALDAAWAAAWVTGDAARAAAWDAARTAAEAATEAAAGVAAEATEAAARAVAEAATWATEAAARTAARAAALDARDAARTAAEATEAAARAAARAVERKAQAELLIKRFG